MYCLIGNRGWGVRIGLALVVLALAVAPSCRKDTKKKPPPPTLLDALKSAIAGLPLPDLESLDPLVREQFDLDYAEVTNLAVPRRLPEQAFNVAMLLHGQGYLDHAKDWYEFVLDLLKRSELRGFDDDQFLCRYYLADVAERAGLTGEALNQVNAALSSDIEDQAALLRRAELMLKLNAGPAAAGAAPTPDAEVHRAFERVLEKGEVAPAYFGLGVLETRRQRPKEAEPHFRKALQIAPDYHTARAALVEALNALDRVSEAEEIAAGATDRPENTAFVDPHLLALRRRTSTEALRLAHWWRLADAGRAEEAEAALRLHLLNQPDDAASLNMLGNIVLTRRLPSAPARLHPLLLAEAKRCFLGALAADAMMLEARCNYAVALLSENNRDGAIEQFREVLLRRDDFWLAHYQLAELLYRDPVPGRRDLAAAETHYRKTIEHDPDNMHAFSGLVSLVEEQGRYEEASRLLKEATLLAPDDPGIADQFARFLLDVPRPELRDPMKAQLIAERVCELSGPDFPEYLETLARAYIINAEQSGARNVDVLLKAHKTIRSALDAAAARNREDILPRLRVIRDQIEGWLREAGQLPG